MQDESNDIFDFFSSLSEGQKGARTAVSQKPFFVDLCRQTEVCSAPVPREGCVKRKKNNERERGKGKNIEGRKEGVGDSRIEHFGFYDNRVL